MRGVPVPGSIARSVAASNSLSGVSRLAGGTGGRDLPLNTRTEMESAFGASFRDVRVYANPGAARLSEHLHAEAFSHGPDLYFGQGKFAPETRDGKHLLAHELAHVVQAKGARDAIRRKVVDNDFHVPCRNSRASAVDTLRKDEVEAIRICRAAAARIQANIDGTDPDAAGFLAALLRRFHLDGTNPGVRTHWLPLLATRYRVVAHVIEQQNRRYNCAEAGVEPSVDCRTRNGLAFTAPGSGETALCDGYWPFSDAFRGGVIAHETFHMIFEWFGDCEVANTDSAECYEMFAREMGGTAGPTTLIECCKPPAGTPPPAVEPPPPIIPSLPPIPNLPFVPFLF